ncbi:MAG: ABC transporter permease [Acidobacteria bacterium]|nr:ABC transporter permease [Acidobacteriota bacterium]
MRLPTRNSREMVFSLGILTTFFFLALMADFFSPYAESEQYRDYFYAPPTRIHFIDREGKFHGWPFVYRIRLKDPGLALYEEDATERYFISFGLRGRPYRFLGLFSWDRHFFGVKGAHLFLLGCDDLGRDLFSRLLFGSQVSLSIGVMATVLSLPIGLAIGSLAGYYGGRWVDVWLMRLTDLFLAMPGLYLVLALRSAFPRDMSSAKIYLMMVVILSFLGWSSLARPIRGIVLSLREREFILAAKGLGASDGRIIIVHILPNIATFALVQATLAIPMYLLAEVMLSYLGIGMQEPLASWGSMLAGAQNLSALSQHWWLLTPGVAIFLVVLGFNHLGDALQR